MTTIKIAMSYEERPSMDLLNRIKELAKHKEITIAELERETGISNGQIGKWGTRSPNVKNIQKVANYFGVSIDYLLGNSSDSSHSVKSEKNIKANKIQANKISTRISIFDRIKMLTDNKGMNIVDVELDLGMSKNYLYKWKTAKPTADRLEQVADYFNVSTDYILGRTIMSNITPQDTIDIQRVINELIQELSNKKSLHLFRNNGEAVNEDDAALLKSSLENVARQSLLLSKKRAQDKK